MHHFTLPNGLQVIIYSNPKIRNSVVNLFLKIGSAQEEYTKTGMAHFLEHMAFEGTASYPNFDESLQQLRAENNAFTTQDFTNYYESFPNEYLESILKIEADRMQNLSLTQDKFKMQQQVILEEYLETSINPPMSDVWHYLLPAAFNDSYSWPVIGADRKQIRAFTALDIQQFYKKSYTADRAILSIVTGTDSTQVTSWVQNLFSPWKAALDTMVAVPTQRRFGERLVLRRKNISNPHFFIAIHIADFGDKDYFAADMLADILAQGESSLLYEELIVKQKLCTEIVAYTSDNLHNNLMTLEGTLSAGVSWKELRSQLILIFDNLVKNGVAPIQWEIALNKARTYWAYQAYSFEQLAFQQAFFSAAGIGEMRSFLKETYDGFSPKDIQVTAQSILQATQWTEVLYLPST